MPGKWKHGYIPLTPAAVMSKNHGHKPGAGSKLSKLKLDASTPKGRAAIRRQMRERDDAVNAAAREAAAKMGFTGPKKRRSLPKKRTRKPTVGDVLAQPGGREALRKKAAAEGITFLERPAANPKPKAPPSVDTAAGRRAVRERMKASEDAITAGARAAAKAAGFTGQPKRKRKIKKK
jgi:hypothetical protein